MSLVVCPACGQKSLTPLEHIDVAEQHGSYAPGDQVMQHDLTAAASESALVYQMLKCLNCGLEFGDPMRAPTAAWYQLAYRAQKLYPEVRWEFNNEVLRRIPKGDRVFEFGCGSGAFLLCCQHHGLSASGIDFSNDAVQECVARGLAVRRLNLDEIAGATDGGSLQPDGGVPFSRAP